LSDVRVPLRPSRLLALAVRAGHAAALGCVWWTIPPAGAAIATLGLALSLVAISRCTARQPHALVLHPDGALDCLDGEGELKPAVLTRASVPAWWLVTLTIERATDGTLSIALLPDSSDRESLRRLRAWLGARRAAPPAAAAPES
jgi:hypothetical protein